MITQQEFDQIELMHGCGYFNICATKDCPCAITTEHKGLQEGIWRSLIDEASQTCDEFDSEDRDIPPYFDTDEEYDEEDNSDFDNDDGEEYATNRMTRDSDIIGEFHCEEYGNVTVFQDQYTRKINVCTQSSEIYPAQRGTNTRLGMVKFANKSFSYIITNSSKKRGL